MKRVEVLPRIEAEAGVRYEDTRLARRAVPARRRLGWLLVAGAAALVIEAAVRREPAWVVGALAVAAAAWGVRRGSLGGVVAAALIAVVAVMLPLAVLAMGPPAAPGIITAAVAIALGAAMLPDVVLLVRDAELQHAFGLWARRHE